VSPPRQLLQKLRHPIHPVALGATTQTRQPLVSPHAQVVDRNAPQPQYPSSSSLAHKDFHRQQIPLTPIINLRLWGNRALCGGACRRRLRHLGPDGGHEVFSQGADQLKRRLRAPARRCTGCCRPPNIATRSSWRFGSGESCTTIIDS
jgi:hypothetical protein